MLTSSGGDNANSKTNISRMANAALRKCLGMLSTNILSIFFVLADIGKPILKCVVSK